MVATDEYTRLELRGLTRRGGVAGAVLVLNGAPLDELHAATALASALTDRSILVAVDGGLETCRAGRRQPDLFVGDVDSTSLPTDGIPTVIFDRDKGFSDLAGALEEVRQRDVQLVTVAGMLGGRLDHEWANLQELGSHATHVAGLLAPSKRGLVLITRHGCRLKTVPDRIVSVFSLGSAATVTLLGTRWELRRRRLKLGSQGLSNLTGSAFDLTVHQGTAAVVFVP
jgi:thiamine pyrophosphokinase